MQLCNVAEGALVTLPQRAKVFRVVGADPEGKVVLRDLATRALYRADPNMEVSVCK